MAELEDYKYPHIDPTDYIDESLEHILARDDAAKHGFRRVSSFPSVTANDVGMKIYLVGQGNFQLISVNPEPQWKQLSDDSRNVAYTDWVSENYQAYSKVLTSLAKLREAVNAIPFFAGPEDIQTINISGYMRNFLSLTDNNEVAETLNFGSAATLDYPIDGKYIEAGTIPVSAISEELKKNLGFTTGDVKLTLKKDPDNGWVMADDGSIGSATSGATNRANADTYDLFMLLWNNPYCTLQTFSGGVTSKTTAFEDWRSNKRLVLPRTLGRVLGVAGSGQSLTTRNLGESLGAESTTLTASQLPSHTHALRVCEDGSKSGYDTGTGYLARGFTKYSSPWSSRYTKTNSNVVVPSAEITGEASRVSLMQPTTYLNMMIKL